MPLRHHTATAPTPTPRYDPPHAPPTAPVEPAVTSPPHLAPMLYVLIAAWLAAPVAVAAVDRLLVGTIDWPEVAAFSCIPSIAIIGAHRTDSISAWSRGLRRCLIYIALSVCVAVVAWSAATIVWRWAQRPTDCLAACDDPPPILSAAVPSTAPGAASPWPHGLPACTDADPR